MPIPLGVRCWKDKVALVALDGEADAEPTIALQRRGKLPSGVSDTGGVAYLIGRGVCCVG